MKKTVKMKGNRSPGTVRKGPEVRPIGAKGKAKQTKPRTTHAKAISVPVSTHHDYGKNLGKYLHKSKLPDGVVGPPVKSRKQRKSNKGRY